MVLPSLAEFEVTVDLRIRVENGEVQDFVPVALAHIDTDAYNNEFWFQLSRADIDILLQKLTNCAREMDLGEELLKKAISSVR